jgi:hypothetical protein
MRSTLVLDEESAVGDFPASIVAVGGRGATAGMGAWAGAGAVTAPLDALRLGVAGSSDSGDRLQEIVMAATNVTAKITENTFILNLRRWIAHISNLLIV